MVLHLEVRTLLVLALPSLSAHENNNIIKGILINISQLLKRNRSFKITLKQRINDEFVVKANKRA